jgi:hypothetical protein
MKYKVYYNGWGIPVEAENKKQARHRAWQKFDDAYRTPYGDFMKGVEDVEEVSQ